MGKDTPAWAAALGGLIVTGIFVVLALVAAGGWNWFAGFLESSAAAWVQAVGSILAIFGAGAIAAWQATVTRREAERVRRKVETDRALTIDFMLRRAKLVVENAERAVRSESIGTLNLARDQVEMVQQALRALPAFEVPSPRLVFDLQRLDRDLFYVLRLIQEAEKPKGRAPRKTGKALFVRVHRRIGFARYAALVVHDFEAVGKAHLTGMGPLHDDDPDGEG